MERKSFKLGFNEKERLALTEAAHILHVSEAQVVRIAVLMFRKELTQPVFVNSVKVLVKSRSLKNEVLEPVSTLANIAYVNEQVTEMINILISNDMIIEENRDKCWQLLQDNNNDL